MQPWKWKPLPWDLALAPWHRMILDSTQPSYREPHVVPGQVCQGLCHPPVPNTWRILFFLVGGPGRGPVTRPTHLHPTIISTMTEPFCALTFCSPSIGQHAHQQMIEILSASCSKTFLSQGLSLWQYCWYLYLYHSSQCYKMWKLYNTVLKWYIFCLFSFLTQLKT